MATTHKATKYRQLAVRYTFQPVPLSFWAQWTATTENVFRILAEESYDFFQQ